MVFGEYLIHKGLIDHSQLKEALAIQDEVNLPIGEVLISMKVITREAMETELNEYMIQKAEELIDDYTLWADHN